MGINQERLCDSLDKKGMLWDYNLVYSTT